MAKNIFISHSKIDSHFVYKLVDDLENTGFKTWVDTNISGGEEWRNMIDKNLRAASEVVVVLSPNAAQSKWVVHETAIAIGAGIPVVPILIEEIEEHEYPVFAEEKQWIDFLGWKDEENYQEALAKLVVALTPPNPIQDLLDQQVLAYQQTGELLGDSLLNYLEENFDKISLDKTAQELLDKSQQQRDQALAVKRRNQKLLQGGVVTLSILLIASIILSVFSFEQTNNLRRSEATAEAAQQEAENRAEAERQARAEAEEQTSLAIAGELAANAASLVNRDPELGMLLAIESLHERYTVQAEETLRHLLVKSKLLTVVTPHQGQQINVVEYSPDGNYILTAGDDQDARIWQARNGNLYREFFGEAGPILHAAFSESGQSITTISDEQTVKIWDVESGEPIFETTSYTATISPDGKFLAIVTSSQEETQIWNTDTAQMIQSIEFSTPITRVEIGPEGKYAIINGTIINLASEEQIDTIQGEVLAFSPNGNIVITAWELPRLAVWNLITGDNLFTFNVEGYTYDMGATFSDDGKRIAVWPIDFANSNQAAYIWSVDTGALLETLRGHEGDVISADFYPRGDFIITGSVDNTLRVWRYYTGDVFMVLSGHTEDVVGVTVSPDSKTIATISLDGTMRTWDATTMKSQIIGDAYYAAFGPYNIITLNTEEDEVVVYSISDNQISKLQTYRNASCLDGKWIFQKIDQNTVQVIDASSGEIVSKFGPVDTNPKLNPISPNGKYLVADNQVWDIETGELISELEESENIFIFGEGEPSFQYFSPDSELAAFPDSDNGIGVWRLATGERIAYFTGHFNVITYFSFSPDAALLVSTSADGTAKVWDIASDQFFFELGESKSVNLFSANFSSDGQYIVMGDWFGKVQIFQASTGQLVRNFVGQNGLSTSAAFSPDGKYIITTSGEFILADYTTRIWEIETGLLLYKDVGNFKGFNNASFSEDSKWAVVIDNQQARLISCEVCVGYEELLQLAEERLAKLKRTFTCEEEQKYLHKDIECKESTYKLEDENIQFSIFDSKNFTYLGVKVSI